MADALVAGVRHGPPLHIAADANALAWGWGGVQRHIAAIAGALAARPDVELHLLANTDRPFSGVVGAFDVPVRRPGGPLWRNTVVLPWLARHRPDVFWVPEGLAPAWTPVPTVLTVHDIGAALLSGIKPWSERLAYRTTIPRAARRAAAVIAVSEATAQDVQQRWRVPAGRVHVIPNGVSAVFEVGDRQRAAEHVHRRFGIQGPYVLHVGTIEPRKGLDVLVAAAAGSAWQLVFAGASGFGATGVLRAAARANTCLLGPVGDSDLVDLYRAAAAVAAPALYEGMGMTPLEAMACGTPTAIAAGSGGLVGTSGEASVVVDERTPDAWRRAIAEAISRRDELVPKGLVLAGRYRWDTAAAATLAVMRSAADEARVRRPRRRR